MNIRPCISALVFGLWVLPAAAADLSFKEESPGVFAFDTGACKGRLMAQPDAQGVVSLVDSRTGRELTKGERQYGLFSFYRLLATDRRWGTIAWEWPKQASIQPDGAVQIVWPGADDHPMELTARYRWSSPGTLDVQASVKSPIDVTKFELFLASYLNNDTRAQVYVNPTIHVSGAPEFVAAEVNPLIMGTYLSFPRDRSAAQMVYDGRYERGLHPVHWSVARFMAAPIALQHDRASGLGVALMARPEGCFAVGLSYNRTPPDNPANHHSTYFSLFGRDLRAGETATARVRAVIGAGLTNEKALEAYKSFLEAK